MTDRALNEPIDETVRRLDLANMHGKRGRHDYVLWLTSAELLALTTEIYRLRKELETADQTALVTMLNEQRDSAWAREAQLGEEISRLRKAAISNPGAEVE